MTSNEPAIKFKLLHKFILTVFSNKCVTFCSKSPKSIFLSSWQVSTDVSCSSCVSNFTFCSFFDVIFANSSGDGAPNVDSTLSRTELPIRLAFDKMEFQSPNHDFFSSFCMAVSGVRDIGRFLCINVEFMKRKAASMPNISLCSIILFPLTTICVSRIDLTLKCLVKKL
uniref:Uncharacterized protein n=1 Tax=Romanomermis culicivorax TaxID=13658 RepID=A0A915J670_ROMCU